MDSEDLQIAELQQANVELRASLAQCHQMVRDYRAKIAANVNVPEQMEDEDKGADRTG